LTDAALYRRPAITSAELRERADEALVAELEASLEGLKKP
jgi:hypothetical protein